MSNVSLTIRKKTKGINHTYEVFADGVKIGQRKSNREYVAAAVYCPGFKWNTYGPDENGQRVVVGQSEQGPGVFSVASWIGREDLIMKNNEVNFGAKVARLVEESKEFEK